MAQDLNAAFESLESVLPEERERQLALSIASHLDLKQDARSLQANGTITLLGPDDEPLVLRREDLNYLRFRLTRLRNFQAEMRQFARRHVFQNLPSLPRQMDFF
jgi:hypothetical protein